MRRGFVQLTQSAVKDLRNIIAYIEQHNPAAAEAVEDAMFQAFDLLSQRPLIGHVRGDVTSQHLRFWTLPDYRNFTIAYRPDTRPLKVVRILHGRRLFGQLV